MGGSRTAPTAVTLGALTLEDLGWTPRFAAAFEPFRAEGVYPARVSLEHTHIYRVMAADGETLARVSGRLRHDASGRADFPAVGDWVVVEPAAGGDARIKAVLPRASHFSRRAAGNPTEEQVVAAIIGEDLLRTREVRESDSRGRHTTTGRQLVLLPGGGILIDTPGMRELQLWDTGESVTGAFADIDAVGEGCRFRDCRHITEPGCAVVAAVAAGMLPAARLESFRKLQQEQAFQATQQDERSRIGLKRIGGIGAKAL